MARKVVVPATGKVDENGEVKVKKKRSKCCTCCLIFTVVNIVLLAVIFVVGWFLGGKYTKQFFDLSMGETLGVVKDLYWTNDKDVVKNPYKKEDLEAFNAEFLRNMLLKPGVCDPGEEIKDAISGMLSGKKSEKKLAGESGGNAITDVFVDMFSNMFTADNIDRVELARYDEDNDVYVFELKDRQLAAFLGMVTDAVLENASDISALSGINNTVNLKKVVKLKQVNFRVQAVSTDEQNHTKGAAAAEMTVWIGLQDAAGQAIRKLLDGAGFGWASGFVAWLGNVLLPENLYATITVPMEDGAKSYVTLNAMDEKERERMYKLVDGVFKNLIKSDMTLDSVLEKIGDYSKNIFKKMGDGLSLDNAGNGSISLDLLGSVVNIANSSLSSGDGLRKQDLMYMLQALLTTDKDARLKKLEPYLYREWYEDPTGVKADVYKYDGSVDVTGLKKIDYEKAFIKEIEDKYALDLGEDAKLDDVLDMLGISLDGGSSGDPEKMLDKVNSRRLKAAVDEPTQKLKITDRMLATIMSGQMDDILKKNDSVKDLKISLEALSFVKRSGSSRTFAILAIDINIGDLLGSAGSNAMLDLVKGIVPDSLLISMTVDVTPNLPAGAKPEKPEYWINDYDDEEGSDRHKTAAVIDTLTNRLPGVSLDLDSLTSEISDKFREMIEELDGKIGVEIVLSDMAETPVKNGSLDMADVFTVMTKYVLTEDGESIVTAEEFKQVIKGLQDTAGMPSSSEIASDYGGFMEDVVDKYYIDETKATGEEYKTQQKISDFDELTTFLTDSSGSVDAGKFRVKEQKGGVPDPNIVYMAYDARSTAGGGLNPVMRPDEIGALVAEKIKDDESLKKFEIVRVSTAKDRLILTLSAETKDLMSDNKAMKALDIDKMFITATVDTSTTVTVGDKTAYPVTVKINNMGDEGEGSPYSNTLKIVNHYSPDFDIQSQTDQIGVIMYETLSGLTDSLGSDDFIRFTSRGMELKNFYDFLATKLLTMGEGEEPPEAETVKAAIQGMYAAPTGMEHSAYNYELGDFLVNAPSVGAPAIDWDSVALDRAEGFTDKEFNGYVNDIIKNDTGASARQTIALAKVDTTESASASYIRGWLNDRMDYDVSESKEYAIITIALDVDKMEMNGDGSAAGFMPNDYIYATVVLEMMYVEDTFDVEAMGIYNVTMEVDKFEYRDLVFNAMGKEEYALVCRMMDLDTTSDTTGGDTVNITSVTNDCVRGLNILGQLYDITLSAAAPADGCIGRVSCELYGISYYPHA